MISLLYEDELMNRSKCNSSRIINPVACFDNSLACHIHQEYHSQAICEALHEGEEKIKENFLFDLPHSKKLKCGWEFLKIDNRIH